MKRMLLVLGLLVWAATNAEAKVVHETVEYEQGGVPLEGYAAWDDALSGPLPGVLVVHQWMGLGDNERMRADMLAKLGYVAFACDIYGKGVRPTNVKEASEQAQKYESDPALYRARLAAGLSQLANRPQVDRARLVAIGYCFGGAGVLELARSGADVKGVVSFHGILTTSMPAKPGDVRCKVLVCQGADDPYAKQADVQALIAEMEAAGVDYEVVLYGHAVHAFTQKAAGDDPSKGAAYNAAADRRSWRAMRDFFDEVLK